MAAKKSGKKRPRAKPIIRTFGVYWRKDSVQWGRAGTRNQLLGSRVRTNRKSVPDVDFWQQTGIYVLYTADFAPVYAGQATRLGARLRAHRLSPWLGPKWQYFSWFGLKGLDKGGTRLLKVADHVHAKTPILLDLLEGILIAGGIQAENKQGPRLHGAQQFFQVVESGA